MNDSSDALAELLTLTVTVNEHGTRIYRNPMGQLHRQHGPAVECADGYKEWYQNDQLHRTTGPALEYGDGARMWYQNDQLHRTTGPAVEWSNGTKEWWLNGQQLTEQEHAHRVNPAQEMTVADIEAALGKRIKIIK